MNSLPWFLFPTSGDSVNQYFELRREFEVAAPTPSGIIRVSAATDYTLFLDGGILPSSQFSDYPDQPTWTEVAVPALAPGRHVVALRVYCKGESFLTSCADTPRAWFEYRAGAFRLEADAQWRCRVSRLFRSGRIEKLTPHLGFVFEADLRRNDDWTSVGFDASDWACPIIQTLELPLRPRPVPPPETEAIVPGRLEFQHPLQIRADRETLPTFAERVCSDRFCPSEAPLPPDEPRMLMYDLGREVSGFLTLEVEASGGEILDISHGEHLLDGTVRNTVVGYSFTDRVICAPGRQTFQYRFRRLACRYLQLNLTQLTDAGIVIHQIGLAPCSFPLPEDAAFSCNDKAQSELRRKSIATLRLCMHEHFEDCPWREQALYGLDSRNQALFGYYLWGNYRFAAASLDLLGRGMREDGLIPLCAPSDTKTVIPVFTFAWILAVAEHWLFSGDGGLFRTHRGAIETALERAWERRTADGLLAVPEGDSIWNFYEWTDGLTGDSGKINAPYQFFAAVAFRAMAKMKRWADLDGADELAKSDALIQAADQTFWDEKQLCYRTATGDDRLHVLTQALALYAHAGTPERAGQLLRTIKSGALKQSTLAILPFLMDGATRLGDAGLSLSEIETIYRPMLVNGNTTIWETARGAADFDGAGSLCHGWSCFPVYFQGRHWLGVAPESPGFATFSIRCAPGLPGNVSGEVPTPHGKIIVRRDANGATSVTAPESCRRIDGGSLAV